MYNKYLFSPATPVHCRLDLNHRMAVLEVQVLGVAPLSVANWQPETWKVSGGMLGTAVSSQGRLRSCRVANES